MYSIPESQISRSSTQRSRGTYETGTRSGDSRSVASSLASRCTQSVASSSRSGVPGSAGNSSRSGMPRSPRSEASSARSAPSSYNNRAAQQPQKLDYRTIEGRMKSQEGEMKKEGIPFGVEFTGESSYRKAFTHKQLPRRPGNEKAPASIDMRKRLSAAVMYPKDAPIRRAYTEKTLPSGPLEGLSHYREQYTEKDVEQRVPVDTSTGRIIMPAPKTARDHGGGREEKRQHGQHSHSGSGSSSSRMQRSESDRGLDAYRPKGYEQYRPKGLGKYRWTHGATHNRGIIGPR